MMEKRTFRTSELSLTDRWIVQYTMHLVRFRWIYLLAIIALTLLVASGIGRIQFSTDFRDYFGPDNPQLLAFDRIEQVYTKNDNILMAVAPGDGDVFTRDTLTAIKEMTEAGWQMPYAIRVDSITNYQHTEAKGDDLYVEDLVPGDPMQLSDKELAGIRDIAMNEPLLVNQLISDKGHVTAVNVTFQIPGVSVHEMPETVAAGRAVRDRILAEYPQLDIHLTGSMMMSNSFPEASQRDMKTLMPVMFAMITLVMWLLLRSVSATGITLMVISTSTLAAMGLTGFLGIELNAPSSVAPIIILTLAVADSIHILITHLSNMRRGMDKRQALIDAMRVNAMPVFLTSITTAIGFLSMNFADSPPLVDLGNITAMGVLAAFVYSVTLLPILVDLLPVRVTESNNRLATLMDRLGGFVVSRYKPVLGITIVIAVVLITLIPQNEVNDEFHKYFDTSFKFRQDTDFIIDNLTGFYSLYYDLDTREPGGVADPEYLAQVEAFANWWLQNPDVIDVQPFTSIMERLNKNMHGDDPAWYRIPEQRDLAAQYLLLYELSLPFGLDLNNQVNIDKSGTKLKISFARMTSRDARRYVREGEAWLQQHAPQLSHTVSSPPLMFSYISERNIQAMFIGTPLALVAISFILIFALRSVKIGLLSLVPNLVPLGMAFGIWSIVDGQIIFTMSLVMGMTLGIIVDNCIHFLSKYLRGRREQGMNAEVAIRFSFRTVGSALAVTSLILISGFSILSFSAFLPNSSMSELTAIGIATALAADLLLLPPLLMILDKKVYTQIPREMEGITDVVQTNS